jgi:F-type H+-transporting ATPase subunit epsilon
MGDHEPSFGFLSEMTPVAKSFRCRLVTPTASLVDEQVVYASIPAWDGLMGVLPGRAPILARLGLGELKLDFADSAKGAGGSRTFVVDGGFLRMAGDSLTLLAERAFAAESITASEVEAEMKQIDARQLPAAGGERAAALDKQRHDKALAELKLKTARALKGI